jgi:hypothetical protein
MRKAAVLAGLVPDTTAGHARLSFVTEGEASLHFAIQNGLPVGAMKVRLPVHYLLDLGVYGMAIQKGDGVVIVDAGGGTIDVSSYSRNTSVSKETFEEVAAPQCKSAASAHSTTSNLIALQVISMALSSLASTPACSSEVRHFFETSARKFSSLLRLPGRVSLRRRYRTHRALLRQDHETTLPKRGRTAIRQVRLDQRQRPELQHPLRPAETPRVRSLSPFAAVNCAPSNHAACSVGRTSRCSSSPPSIASSRPCSTKDGRRTSLFP